jgi:hypothetical protein
MKSAFARGAVAATLIATAVGTGAWLLGWSQVVWPGHPMIAAFILTVVTYVVVKQLWTRDHSN